MRRIEPRIRTSLLAALTVIALAVAVGPAPGGAQTYSEWGHYRRIELDAPGGPSRVLGPLPRRGDHLEHPPGERYPILIALHGAGEADPERGYLGWATLYDLPHAFEGLMRGHVSASDYRRFVRDPHLAYVNDSLRTAHFRGVMVVTPYVPDVGGEEVSSAEMRAIGDWLAGPLVDAVRERFDGAARTREGTGIDGVSMGGRVALEVGLSHPDVFGAVEGIQPAVRGREDALAALATEAARAQQQRVRLLTSDEDPFVWSTRRLSSALVERRLTHTLTVVPGPHDYAFNRGPAGLEMLLFHDRALAHEPLPE